MKKKYYAICILYVRLGKVEESPAEMVSTCHLQNYYRLNLYNLKTYLQFRDFDIILCKYQKLLNYFFCAYTIQTMLIYSKIYNYKFIRRNNNWIRFTLNINLYTYKQTNLIKLEILIYKNHKKLYLANLQFWTIFISACMK